MDFLQELDTVVAISMKVLINYWDAQGQEEAMGVMEEIVVPKDAIYSSPTHHIVDNSFPSTLEVEEGSS